MQNKLSLLTSLVLMVDESSVPNKKLSLIVVDEHRTVVTFQNTKHSIQHVFCNPAKIRGLSLLGFSASPFTGL